MSFAVPYTGVPGILVPAIPPPATAELLALQFQLEQSQWWPPDILADAHRVQLSALLNHAARQVPFYRERLAASGWRPDDLISDEQFRRIPLLQRAEAMEHGEALRATELPQGHEPVKDGLTSGSTGRALRFWTGRPFRQMQYAFHLRLYLWHRWNFTLANAGILVDHQRKAPAPEGRTFPHWGPWLADIYPTGPYHFLSARTPVDDQLAWLAKRRPAYLQSYPSNLGALFERAGDLGRDLSFLQGVSTLGELVTAGLRETVRTRLGKPLVDVYSSQEMGYMAIQCPRHEHYHVQAENVVLEVLDEQGQPCRPGQIGRVVVTTLHNFAAPLIRYEIGDYAEVGDACACGRPLPLLKRILGRVRNMVTKPDGQRAWPHFGTRDMHRIAPIRQFQIVQKSLERIELILVVPERLSAEVEGQLKSILVDSLEHPFQIEIRYADQIARSPGGKFEDFVSEV